MDHDTITDADLARLVAAGDRAAAGRLVRRHEGVVWAALTRDALKAAGCPPSVDPHDIAQECFIACLKAVPRWDQSRGSLATFLYRVVRFEVSDYLRRERRHRYPAAGLAGDPDPFEGDPAPEPVARPDFPGLDRLDPVARMVVVMRFGLEGNVATWKEVGGRLGLTPSQGKWVLAKALKKLRWHQGAD